MHNFASFLKAIRSLTAKSEDARLQRMFLLVETKPLSIVWRSGPYRSWHALLRGEHLCPAAYFDSFELATQTFPRKLIEEIGADAAVVLVRVDKSLHDRLVQTIKGFIAMKGVRPSRRLIWSWARTIQYMPPLKATKRGLRSHTRH